MSLHAHLMQQSGSPALMGVQGRTIQHQRHGGEPADIEAIVPTGDGQQSTQRTDNASGQGIRQELPIRIPAEQLTDRDIGVNDTLIIDGERWTIDRIGDRLGRFVVVHIARGRSTERSREGYRRRL